jgi:hypothetical protein
MIPVEQLTRGTIVAHKDAPHKPLKIICNEPYRFDGLDIVTVQECPKKNKRDAKQMLVRTSNLIEYSEEAM